MPVRGIGPLFKAYESFVLPLNYTGENKITIAFLARNAKIPAGVSIAKNYFLCRMLRYLQDSGVEE